MSRKNVQRLQGVDPKMISAAFEGFVLRCEARSDAMPFLKQSGMITHRIHGAGIYANMTGVY
jgi:hypothetical protein